MANEPTSASSEKAKSGPKTGIVDFITETRREIAKVTWPTRREIWLTTTLIVVFAIIAGVFFLGVDSILGRIVSYLLGMD